MRRRPARWCAFVGRRWCTCHVAAARAATSDACRRREHDEARFRDLTELSADWFWETDAEHRIRWLSGGAPVATFFGETPTYGKRFWEIPGSRSTPRALARPASASAREQPFFDLEIARSDERGARQVHIISGPGAPGRRRQRSSATAASGATSPSSARAERALSQAKERLELALDGGDLAEWDYDVDEHQLYLGDGWVRFLGREQSPAWRSAADLSRAASTARTVAERRRRSIARAEGRDA